MNTKGQAQFDKDSSGEWEGGSVWAVGQGVYDCDLEVQGRPTVARLAWLGEQKLQGAQFPFRRGRTFYWSCLSLVAVSPRSDRSQWWQLGAQPAPIKCGPEVHQSCPGYLRMHLEGVPWWFKWLRLWAPNAGGSGSIPGQGARSCILQLRVFNPQQRSKILRATVKTQWWLSGKESTRQCRRHEFNPWAGKIPWRRKWQPAAGFLPRKFHRGAWGGVGGRLQSKGSKRAGGNWACTQPNK